MPELETPKFPQGVKPRLSPNPNDPGFIPEEGERGTPVVINTQPAYQQEDEGCSCDLSNYTTKDELTAVESEVSAKMGNPMTAANDLIVGGTSGAPTRLAKGANGSLLGIDGSGAVGYKKDLPYLDTAPSANNANGIILVVLDEEPATYYNGYYYIITEAGE